MSTQTDPARDFSDRDNDSMMSCQAEPSDYIDADATAMQFAQMVLPQDVDYGGSMVPNSPVTSVGRHEGCDDSNATFDSGYRRPAPSEEPLDLFYQRSRPPSEADGAKRTP